MAKGGENFHPAFGARMNDTTFHHHMGPSGWTFETKRQRKDWCAVARCGHIAELPRIEVLAPTEQAALDGASARAQVADDEAMKGPQADYQERKLRSLERQAARRT